MSDYKFSIEANNVNKIFYKNSEKLKALIDFSLKIKKGTIHGLLGPNGAGKSTFINILGGLVKKNSGHVNICGIDIDKNIKLSKFKIGIVPQELNIDPFFSPAELLELQAGLYGVPKRKRKTDEILDNLKLLDQRNAYSRTLSGGMRRRLLIAKALVHDPDIVVLDEPTAGVDIDIRSSVWDYIRRIKKLGKTICLTTHYLEEAENLCDNITIINFGKKMIEGSKNELLNIISTKTVTFILENQVKIPNELNQFKPLLKNNILKITYDKNKTNINIIINILNKYKIDFKEINTIEGDLEDVFLFWISLLIISFFSYKKIYSFQDAAIFIRFLLIPFFAYFIFCNNNKFLYNTIFLIFLIIVFICIDTTYQFFNYSSKSGFGEDLLGFKSNWYGRLTGPFGDELIPGSYISKFGLLGYAYIISNKKFEKKIILQSIYLSFILFVSYISGERMAFATFGLGLFFLLIFLDGFRRSIILSILIGSILIFLAIYLHPFYNDFKVIESTQYHQGLKIEKTFECENGKLCSKVFEVQPSFFEIIKNFKTSTYGEIYLLSFKMFKDNLITGIGINNFEYLCNSVDAYKNLMVNYDCASHPHNMYIQWLAEGGIIVFSTFNFYLIFLISFIINNIGEKKYKVISLAIILIMFWPIMSTGSLIKNWFGITTFFIIGLCMSISKFKNSD